VLFSASVLPFTVLYFAVFGNQREELVGKGDTTTARLGLDLDFD
jgi:hypothetical protein